MAQLVKSKEKELGTAFHSLWEKLYRKELGEHGKCVSCVGFGKCEFLLIRDADCCFNSHKSRYILAIVSLNREELCVFSDIPTIISGCYVGYSDNAVEFDASFKDGILKGIYPGGFFYDKQFCAVILEKRFANRSYTLPLYTCEAVRVCQGSKKRDANGNPVYVEYRKDDLVFLKLRTSIKCWKFLMEYNFKTPQEMVRVKRVEKNEV